MELPAEFTCPITCDKMADPVVATDGHSYERSAIEAVINSPDPLSPLTREALGHALVPNRNLRCRIEEHDAEIDRMAVQIEARMAEAAAKAKTEAAEAAAKAKATIEALQQQLKEAKEGKRGREAAEGSDEEEEAPAPKRHARATRSGGGGRASS